MCWYDNQQLVIERTISKCNKSILTYELLSTNSISIKLFCSRGCWKHKNWFSIRKILSTSMWHLIACHTCSPKIYFSHSTVRSSLELWSSWNIIRSVCNAWVIWKKEGSWIHHRICIVLLNIFFFTSPGLLRIENRSPSFTRDSSYSVQLPSNLILSLF